MDQQSIAPNPTRQVVENMASVAPRCSPLQVKAKIRSRSELIR